MDPTDLAAMERQRLHIPDVPEISEAEQARELNEADDAMVRLLASTRTQQYKRTGLAKTASDWIDDALRDDDELLDVFWISEISPLEAGHLARKLFEKHRRAFVAENLEAVKWGAA